MSQIAFWLATACAIAAAVWHIAEAQRLRRMGRDLLAEAELWEALKQGEIRAVMGWKNGATWELSNKETRREVAMYDIEIGRN